MTYKYSRISRYDSNGTSQRNGTEEDAEYADSIMEKGGVIRYTNFTHIDVREERYRKGV